MKLWIAREKGGLLQIFRFRPWQGDNMPTEWYHIGGCFPIDSKDFPEVTFENSPQEVELKLKDSNGVGKEADR